MTSRYIAITGANGFIGAALTRALVARGVRVIALTRSPANGASVTWRPFDLRSPGLPEGLFDGVEAIVHCALVRAGRSLDAFAVNVEGARRLFLAAKASGTRMVFVSSMSANHSAASAYGRQKFAIEQLVDRGVNAVIRPGLVLGAGGLFGRAIASASIHGVVPLIDGGRQPVQPVYVGDLAASMEDIVLSGKAGTFTIGDSNGVTYRELYSLIARALRTRFTFLPVPFPLALFALRCAAAVHMPMPVDVDNLLGLRYARLQATSPYDTFGVAERSVVDAVRQAVEDMRKEGMLRP